MDDQWERSIPYFTIDHVTAVHLFRRFDPRVKVEQVVPLTEGKRNSNYKVSAADGDQTYLLRIFPLGEDSWRKEAGLRRLLSDRVPLQPLHFMGKEDILGNRTFAIYQYAEGRSFLDWMRSGFIPEEPLLEQIGSLLAVIHSHRYGGLGFLDEQLQVEQTLPPLETWYGMFLNANVRDRLGPALSVRIERWVEESKDLLREIDRTVSLTHGDFRPTNVLIEKGRVSSILDWEFAMAGHPIADLGQWFRYEEQFPAHKQALVRAYNEHSVSPLPEDWEDQGRLRDLVNLLQMIGVNESLPYKFEDLKRLIERMVLKKR